MALEFNDGTEALRHLIDASGKKCEWSEDAYSKHTFRSQRKGIVNYWSTNGTVQCQEATA